MKSIWADLVAVICEDSILGKMTVYSTLRAGHLLKIWDA